MLKEDGCGRTNLEIFRQKCMIYGVLKFEQRLDFRLYCFSSFKKIDDVRFTFP